MQAQPVLGAVVAFHPEQRGLCVVPERIVPERIVPERIVRQGIHAHTEPPQFRHVVVGREPLVRRAIGVLALHLHEDRHRTLAAPAVALEVVGNAAHGVVDALPDIAPPVAVEVHRVRPVARRDELSVTHGPRVGAREIERAPVLFAGEQQELRQFAAEERSSRRVVEAERRKRVDHPKAARDAAIARLDPQYRHHDLRRDPVLPRRAGEYRFVPPPELHPLLDTARRQEQRAILAPGLDPFRGARDRFEDPLLALRRLEPGEHVRAVEPVAFDQFVDVSQHISAFPVVGPARARAEEAGERRSPDPLSPSRSAREALIKSLPGAAQGCAARFNSVSH